MSQIDLVELGARVKEARRVSGLTQAAVAEMASVSRTRLIALELGYAPDMSISNVLRLLNGVGLDLRLTTFNAGRPTLDDLLAEDEAEGYSPRM
ncbi:MULTISPECIES: helix-turn-helix transcriptional regulator [unclassified Methylobacterium]|uniref:helix-turn-helix transcriptional regulator n=1 Tax=unclassified Methylobacterium TaxID=2615210 RepID=UPI002269B848|nr:MULTISPECIES: helix-turn-helix transcriptional regulator [unclassified Methylobacterium]